MIRLSLLLVFSLLGFAAPAPSQPPAEGVSGDNSHSSAAAAAASDIDQGEASSRSSSSPTYWCSEPSCSERATKACSACSTARYCGVMCQKRQWGHHRDECKQMKEARDNIPRKALFWITYNTRLKGQGDRMMAEKIAARIRELGFMVRVIAHSDFEAAASDGPLPTAIINVPDSELPRLGVAKNVPLITIKEAGYTSDEQDEALGLSKPSLGMLLDLGLMSLCRRRLNADPSLLIETFHKLSASTRSWLSSRVGLSSTSSECEIREALEGLDLYFGYSAQSGTRSGFLRTAMTMIRAGRTSLVAFAAEPDGTVSNDIDTSYLGKLSHEDFTLLLSLARYALVTGDRSLEEALSLGIPFTYEQLEHKRALARQLMALFQAHHLTRGATHLSLPIDNPGLATFFNDVHQNYRLRDLTLLRLLQTLSSKKTYSIDALMTHFELEKVYKLSIDEICQLNLAVSGKVVDEAVRIRYGLTEDHRFAFESGGSGYYLLRLLSP